MFKKKCLITGAGGFIGYNLLKFLSSKNINVTGLDNFLVKNSNFQNTTNKKIINCDILDKKKLNSIIKDYDIIIHLAAIEDQKFLLKYPNKAFDINFNGTKNIVDNLSSNQLFVYFSTNIVYGNIKKTPLDETHQTLPNEVYGISKLISENYINFTSQYKNYKYCIVRNFNTFGPHQGNNSYIPSLINSALQKNKFEIWNANKIRDLQYIDDLCENLLNLIKNQIKTKKNIIVNAASGNSYSAKYIADIISKFLKVKYSIKNKDLKNVKKIKKLVNVNKFKKTIKGKYKVSNFKVSLLKTINFYKLKK